MTIAQQLKIKDFPFVIRDKNGKKIYFEDSNGYWVKSEYDVNGNQIYWEDSDKFWSKFGYDANGRKIYCENSTGYWVKHEYNAYGSEIYYEDSTGVIIDNRPKTEVQKAIELLEKEGLLVDGKILKN